MRRRTFVAAAGAASATLVLPASGRNRPWLIGALFNGTKVQSDIDGIGPFRAVLLSLGYAEGADFTLAERYTDGQGDALPALAAGLVALSPDLIVTSAVEAVVLHQLTTTIPIVARLNDGAVAQLVENIAHPIGNVTGVVNSSGAITGKQIDLVRELLPASTRIGMLTYPPSPEYMNMTRIALQTNATHGFTATLVEVNVPGEVLAAFRHLAAEGVEAVVVGSGSVFSGDRALVVSSAAQVRLPTVYNEQGYVHAGGLICYGAHRRANFERLAHMAVRILLGAEPSDIPAEASTYSLAVNLITATALGLTIPSKILARADLVIE